MQVEKPVKAHITACQAGQQLATLTIHWKAEEWFVHYWREQGIYYKPREGWNMVDIDIVSITASKYPHGTSILNIVSSIYWKTDRDQNIIPDTRAVFIIFATITLIILVIFFTIRDLTKKH